MKKIFVVLSVFFMLTSPVFAANPSQNTTTPIPVPNLDLYKPSASNADGDFGDEGFGDGLGANPAACDTSKLETIIIQTFAQPEVKQAFLQNIRQHKLSQYDAAVGAWGNYSSTVGVLRKCRDDATLLLKSSCKTQTCQ